MFNNKKCYGKDRCTALNTNAFLLTIHCCLLQQMLAMNLFSCLYEIKMVIKRKMAPTSSPAQTQPMPNREHIV